MIHSGLGARFSTDFFVVFKMGVVWALRHCFAPVPALFGVAARFAVPKVPNVGMRETSKRRIPASNAPSNAQSHADERTIIKLRTPFAAPFRGKPQRV